MLDNLVIGGEVIMMMGPSQYCSVPNLVVKAIPRMLFGADLCVLEYTIH